MQLMKASHQWATRPNDERFLNLKDLYDKVHNSRIASGTAHVAVNQLKAVPIKDDERGLMLAGPEGGTANITNWAYNQLAINAGYPAGYISTLPGKLAAENINYGISQLEEDKNVQMLLTKINGNDDILIRAVTGPKYNRIWNDEVVKFLINKYGDGTDGDFVVPGIFGTKLAEVTKENTTIFGSDRDFFVFLADEQHKLTIPNRRDGQAGELSRGFFMWNSEVGAQTLGVATFLFDFVCANRIVWGATDFTELKLKHTLNAADRWFSELIPELERYANQKASNDETKLIAAQNTVVEDSTKFLTERLSLPKNLITKKLVSDIEDTHLIEEGKPIETVWDAVTAVTAHAKEIPYQDQRVRLEKAGGKLLDLAA